MPQCFVRVTSEEGRVKGTEKRLLSALATHLETGFDRIDLFCFLDGLGVFEILDENVLDVDGNGMEEIERVREGLSGVPDEC